MSSRFLYFGYGSNMLTERLQGRCPSAEPQSIAVLSGFSLGFSKPSSDGSGKAAPEERAGAALHGVLFSIQLDELQILDRVEGEGTDYARRIVDVRSTSSSEPLKAVTYFGLKYAEGLTPFKWYQTLVLAGAMQHGLPHHHQQHIRQFEALPDPKPNHRSRRAAIKALEQSGFHQLLTED